MKSLLAALFLTASLFPDAIADTSLQHLRCEYLTDPLGIDVAQPRLSWKLESGDLKPERGVRQSAYQILVASSDVLSAASLPVMRAASGVRTRPGATALTRTPRPA